MTIQSLQICLLFLLGGILSAQETLLQGQPDLIQSNLSKVPKERVIDLGEAFSNNWEAREELNQKLKQFAKAEKFSIYFVTYSGIIGSDVTTKAQGFRDDWLGSHTEGLVFVCDTDLRTMSYALTRAELSAEGKSQVWKLPDHEIIAAISELAPLSKKKLSKAEFLEATSSQLLAELENRIQARNKPKKNSSFGYLIVFTLTAGLIYLLIWWAQKRRATEVESEKVGFPEITTEARLGAQYGGGVVAEITFQPSLQQREP